MLKEHVFKLILALARSTAAFRYKPGNRKTFPTSATWHILFLLILCNVLPSLNHSNSHSDFSFILFCNFFTCWVLFYVAWTHPKATEIPWQPTCACCECFKKLAFSSCKSAQTSRDCSASQQHRTQFFTLCFPPIAFFYELAIYMTSKSISLLHSQSIDERVIWKWVCTACSLLFTSL